MVVALILTGGIACIYMLRFYRLKKNLKEAALDLKEIERNPEDNRILLISYPDKQAELFLKNMNAYISLTRKERIFFQRREKELRAQIENISHDLRTPLTSIIGYLELMDRSKLGDEDAWAVEAVLRKANSLQGLIGNFYDLSRLEMNDYNLQPERVELTRFVQETSLLFYQEFERNHIRVEFDFPEKEVYLQADKGALERILNNMMQNALRYAKSELKAAVREQEGMVRLVFENDTEDLTPEDVSHLFERFYMKEKSRTSQSSGLGLTISKLMAEAMGGSVEAELVNQRLRICYKFPGA